MAEAKGPESEDSAEKAYAAAAEAVTEKPAEPAADDQPVVEFPSQAKRGRKPRPVALPEEVETAVFTQPKAPAAPAPVEAASPAPAKKPRKAAAKPQAMRKPVPARKPAVAAKTVKKVAVNKKTPTISQLKDKIMATKSKDFTDGLKGVIAEAQDKAKAAFEKSSSAIGEYTEFAKGNVEAAVESGKILTAGLQEIGSSYVAEGRNALETLTADVKQLAAVKSPADFFKLQGEFVRRNFDQAVAFGSKNSEAVLKLASEAAAPLTGRVNLAVEKIKQAA